MPDLIVIVGPPASGKAAIGQALADLTGFRLFHNHLTADAAAALFGWGTPLYFEATSEMRMSLLTRALSQPDSPSIIFTFVWAFDLAEDHRFMARLAALFTERGQRVFYVELRASLATRLAREGSEFRLKKKPAKHDVAGARALQLDFEARFRMNSNGDFPEPTHHLVIDTELQGPEASAGLVCDRFLFRRRSGASNMHSITPAVRADAAVIHAIQMRAFAEEGRLSGTTQIPPLMEAVEAIDLHIRTQTVLTARDGERIVGSARGIIDGSTCTIRGVSVEPSHQGRGIGAALLRAVEQAHPAVERFQLTTNTLVPGNVSFYERHGYRVAELTKYGDKVVLAQMVKVVGARGTSP